MLQKKKKGKSQVGAIRNVPQIKGVRIYLRNAKGWIEGQGTEVRERGRKEV